ncbi:hypothetical protein K493DRAFT_297416 [Basidiobolus meristosporus CBS 931.73]|uniref:Ubiquitin-like domain-containing protein n=1 Tax=Basidiobolus meristosporus CBS 931.73 TaxID=1314790 RepID=A0A1Y1YZZ6_9FUNG|nr:hypothetical protein K493DRAFT_297416 [Basidiobolus meristosporus CBS 931.73]|eukprot:ORY03529.1 hypothetical protein K493DRAFT_297416 [Basidiobolus meristosporus CBS 931.73]
MVPLYINLPGSSRLVCLEFDSQPSVAFVKSRVHDLADIPLEEQRILTFGGLPLDEDYVIESNNTHPTTLKVQVALAGGKGGFGSMLRAQGGRMSSKKTTNYDSCRDLSGTRLKTIKAAKRIADYAELEEQREREKNERINRKIEEALKERPVKKIRFDDPEFLQESQDLIEEVKSAVSEVMKSKKKGDTKDKGKEKEQVVPKQSAKLSMWDEFSDMSSDEEDVEASSSSSSAS